jgi:CheY-like chemotaxis protein
MPAVLFVTHDADLRAVASRVLIAAGHDVTTAAHAGHASLACMERGPFEVLVIEDLMGDGAGAAIASRLRRYCPGLQVVRMCNATPGTSLDGITVVRPFTADDLIGAVTAATAYALRGATTR